MDGTEALVWMLTSDSFACSAGFPDGLTGRRLREGREPRI
jgi:hypothetical protein